MENRNNLEDLDVSGRLLIEWSLKKYDVTISNGFICPRKVMNMRDP
jgi:hypothetical protein